MHLKENEKGITLIALVITIIVLLILSGVSMAMLGGEKGIIKRTEEAKKQHEIAEEKEIIKLEITSYETGRLANTLKNGIQDFKHGIFNQGLVENAGEPDIMGPNENGILEIVTKKGNLYEVSVEEETQRIISDVEYINPKEARVNIGVSATTIKIRVVNPLIEPYKYYIKKSEEPDSSYQLKNADDTSKSLYQITGLEKNISYDVKVEVGKGNALKTVVKTIRTAEIEQAIVTLKEGSVSWLNGNISATLQIKDIKPYEGIEWTTNPSLSWTKLPKGQNEITVTNQPNGTTIYVRKTEEDKYGAQGQYTLMDTVNPAKAEISVPTGEFVVGANPTTADINVKMIDNESGINIEASKWEVNTSSTLINDESKFTNTFKTNPEVVKIPTIKSGTYYLHVLSIDKAGNKTETISKPIIVKPATDWKELSELAKLIAEDSSITNRTDSVTKTVKGKQITLKVGDIKKINYDGKLLKVRVLGFNHDELTNPSAYGNITETGKAGISFEFIEFMSEREMNGTRTNVGGWEATKLRKELNSEEELRKLENKDYIKDVKKIYIPTQNVDNTNISNDKLWMLSASEVGRIERDSVRTVTKEGEQYEYYSKSTSLGDFVLTSRQKGPRNGNANEWWLRSPPNYTKEQICIIKNDGVMTCTGANYSNIGVAPGFAI